MRPLLTCLGVIIIDDLVGKDIPRIMAEHLAELILVELEVDLHPRLIGGCRR